MGRLLDGMVQIDLLEIERIRRVVSVLLFKRGDSEEEATERGVGDQSRS